MSHYRPYPVYKDSGVEWLGRVPEHWGLSQLKHLVSGIESGTSVNATDTPAAQGEYGVLKTSCVYSGKFDPAENKAILPEEYDRATCPLVVGSLIVSRMNTPDLVGAAGLVDIAPEGVFLPDRLWQVSFLGTNSSFVYFWSQSASYRAQVKMVCTGTSSSMQNLSQDQFKDFVLGVPGLEEQQVIAAHLERETARIDALMEKKTRFIELLREKRQALITHAVTKGLDLNVKMKDSGVEWLGGVPEHWDVLSFQRCVFIAEGQVDPEKSPYLEMLLLAPNHIESGSGRLLYTETAEEQNAESGKYLCQKGDVVYSKIRPALRKVCMAPEVGLCSADMYPLRGHSGMSNQFLFWFLLSEPFSAFAVLEADRVAMPKINRESLNSVQLPRPPFAEQVLIAARLELETARLDNLRSKTERSIELLKERRSALITAAVTGQIDLREAV
ncbi:restriction endonuclease subunit S [Pseudomonas sp. Marseille-Q1929]|uniref:restriction endonuclease subunit S n=1 Tax=Pseudomonas sp. Marseille-Q1929 TaxID=2730402 RepID=UPI001A8FA2D2|nr:restriction endonuclease subunit S [Pseudomonas sp. Marseille-Q1929]